MANRQRLLDKMAALPDEIRKEIAAAVRQSADEIVMLQKSLAPVRTGKLRDSIKASYGSAAPKYASMTGGSSEGDPELTAVISAGNSAVRYAHLVEFGTKPHEVGGKYEGAEHPGTSPEPFFYPGYRAGRRRAKSRITRATKKAAQKVASGQ
jgi:HK97 gp10 family phage protein